MIKSIKSRWSMKLSDRPGFEDVVVGHSIGYYIDCYGDEYMSEIPFSFFNFRYMSRKSKQTP